MRLTFILCILSSPHLSLTFLLLFTAALGLASLDVGYMPQPLTTAECFVFLQFTLPVLTPSIVPAFAVFPSPLLTHSSLIVPTSHPSAPTVFPPKPLLLLPSAPFPHIDVRHYYS